MRAGTVEGCYMNLFKGNVDMPPLFIEQMVHVVLRNILDGCTDTLVLRAAELLFREQKATILPRCAATSPAARCTWGSPRMRTTR